MATENGICREVVYIDGAEFVFKDSPESETAKQILTRLFNKSGLGLYKAVEKAKDAHPGMTSAQNISNKFKRNTIDLLEMIYLAEACGYTINFNQIGDKAESDSSPIMAIDDSPRVNTKEKKELIKREIDDKANNRNMLKMIREGYDSVTSQNLGAVTFAGKNAEEAALKYRIIINSPDAKKYGKLTPIREITIIKLLENDFNVLVDFVVPPDNLNLGE